MNSHLLDDSRQPVDASLAATGLALGVLVGFAAWLAGELASPFAALLAALALGAASVVLLRRRAQRPEGSAHRSGGRCDR